MTDVALKAAHRAMWAAGDYPGIAAELVAPLGEVLVQAAAVAGIDRVLDVAAGTGNAAVAAARRGARAVAADLTPELLEAGRAVHGDLVDWVRADAEDLPFLDADFDVALSCIGVMFAPFHQRGAAELLRVCRPGGRVGLLAWTPQGFIGQMFATMRPYAAPPPPGASPPPLWGDPAHVTGLFGHGLQDVTTTCATLRVDAFAGGGPGALREYFKQRYGPTIATYRRLGEDADAVAALDGALDDLTARHTAPDGSMAWEYLLVVGTRTAV
ncbi:MAG: class I SAM-dependent methyltransferase [Dermatophilaceae bacterium]